MNPAQQQEYPKVDKVKLAQSTEQIIQQVDKNQPNISVPLIQEILVQSGFHSNDINAYKLIAHVTDLWLNEIGDSIIGKKSGMMDRKKKEKDPEIKLQLSTEDLINDLEQKGIKLHKPYQHPSIDPKNLKL